MKKRVKLLVTIVCAIVILCTSAISAAAEFDFGGMPEEFSFTESTFENPYTDSSSTFESKTSSHNNLYDYDDEIRDIYKNALEEQREIKNTFNFMMIFIPILIVIVLGLVLAEIIYIYYAAPKCGMSRAWALLPLFSNVLGLIIFIIIKQTMNNNAASGNTIICPTCNSVQPYGTAVCPICGTNLVK